MSSKILFYLSTALGGELFVTKEASRVLVKIFRQMTCKSKHSQDVECLICNENSKTQNNKSSEHQLQLYLPNHISSGC